MKFLKNSALFKSESGADNIYTFNRNNPSRIDLLKYMERLWEKYRPYCGDSHFVSEFKDKFRARWWELFLANSILDGGFQLQKGSSEGPDICLDINGQKTWIEAISMDNGDIGKPDSVPEVTYGRVNTVPSDKILLRLTSGIETKKKKIQGYIRKGIVKPKDAVIIALNMSGVSHADVSETDYDLPMGALICYGKAESVMLVPLDPSRKDQIEVYNPDRLKLNKASGSEVNSAFFLNEENSFITGIITNLRIFTETEASPRCLKYFDNPLAKAKIDFQKLDFLRNMYWVEDDHIRGRNLYRELNPEDE